MKVTVFNGSPRGSQSNTHVMVGEFITGACDAGAEVENIFLAQKKIHHCVGCFSCWLKTPGKCAIDDDMTELLPKMIESDIVVYAAPVYVGGVPGIMKNFIDRMVPISDPRIDIGPNGICRHRDRYSKMPKVVIISNCGFPEQYHFQFFRSTFQYLAEVGGMEIIAEIYRGGGAVLGVKNILLDMFIGGYKKLLRKAGKEIIEKGTLSDKTKEELNKPLIPADQYVKHANDNFNKILADLEKSKK